MLNSHLRSVGNLPTHPYLDDKNDTRGPDELADVNGMKQRGFASPLSSVAAQIQNVANGAEKLPQIEPTANAGDRKPLRADRLCQSGMKQAFEGKLVPQDPTDEPASVLLERLRANRSVYEGSGKPTASVRSRDRRAKSKQASPPGEEAER